MSVARRACALAIACSLAAPLLASVVPRARASGAAPAPKHLLFVVIDTLRRDAVGLYGQRLPTTPFIDSLGEHGLVYDEVSTQASHTFNSTASMFTSRWFPRLSTNEGYRPHPRWSRARAANMAPHPALAPENETLAETLRDAGFHTLAVFSNPHHHESSGFWQGFAQALYVPPDDPPQQHATADQVQDRFFELLDRAPIVERPLYMHLHFMDPHTPYRPPARLARRFAPSEGRDVFVRHGIPAQPPSAQDLARMRGLYAAEVRNVDDTLRRVARELERRGLWRDTLVVIAADHGEEFMEHGGLGHGASLEREVLRAPLVLGNATGRERGRFGALVRNLDLAPSLLVLLGIDVPATHRGQPLPGVAAGAGAAPSSFAWWKSMRSLTTKRWHLSRDLESGSTRLYDLGVDPDGREDRSHLHAEALSSLRDALARFERLRERAPGTAAGPIAPEILEQLEALGYGGAESEAPTD